MVHLLQVLCPERHCLFALTYEVEAESIEPHAQAARQARAVMAPGGYLNPWCGICGSHTLTLEVGVTKWQTQEEAQPHLEEQERQQIATRAHIETQRN